MPLPVPLPLSGPCPTALTSAPGFRRPSPAHAPAPWRGHGLAESDGLPSGTFLDHVLARARVVPRAWASHVARGH